MKNILVAFVWTMIFASLVGVLAGLACQAMDFSFWVGPTTTVTISLVDGWIQSRHLLAKRLGHKPGVSLINTNRLIPIAFESVLPNSRKSVEVVEEIKLRLPSGVEIDERTIKDFVWKGQARFAASKPAFSRRYWLKSHRPRMTREAYEGLVMLLEENNLIIGRDNGRSGRLAHSYEETIRLLKG